MGKTYYMHTMDGKPAYFDGDQIVFAMFYGKASPLAVSLRQIRAEQKKSQEYRESMGFPDYFKYGHLRFRVPDECEEGGDGT